MESTVDGGSMSSKVIPQLRNSLAEGINDSYSIILFCLTSKSYF